MNRSAYVADVAGWMFLAGDTISIGLSVADDSALLPELWNIALASPDASKVLDVLTRGGISSTPDFAIVTLGANGKVLVRGAATVVVEGSEQVTLTGAGLSSWAERALERIDRFTCEIRPVPDAVPLPIAGGAVRAGWFAGDTAGVGVFASTPVVEPVETPVASAPSVASEATVAAIDELEDEPEKRHEPAEPLSTGSSGGGDSATPYDFLFGDTSYRTVEDAAVRPTADDTGESTPTPGIEDRTVVASDLAELRAKRRAGRGRAVAETPVASFFVELSTGGEELLDQPLVIGRAPSATALGGDRLPRLITMTTPNQDISRTHAQIAVEGGTVVVTDLHSRNGTIVTMPGRPALKLREGEPTVVIPGTVIDLGDGATLTVRES